MSNAGIILRHCKWLKFKLAVGKTYRSLFGLICLIVVEDKSMVFLQIQIVYKNDYRYVKYNTYR